MFVVASHSCWKHCVNCGRVRFSSSLSRVLKLVFPYRVSGFTSAAVVIYDPVAFNGIF